MVCCANDIQFLGLIARGDGLDQFQNRDWMEVTAKMAVEKHKAYKGRGPVMNILSLSPCEKPAQEVAHLLIALCNIKAGNSSLF